MPMMGRMSRNFINDRALSTLTLLTYKLYADPFLIVKCSPFHVPCFCSSCWSLDFSYLSFAPNQKKSEIKTLLIFTHATLCNQNSFINVIKLIDPKQKKAMKIRLFNKSGLQLKI